MEVVGWVEAAIVVTRTRFLDCSKIYKERGQRPKSLHDSHKESRSQTVH